MPRITMRINASKIVNAATWRPPSRNIQVEVVDKNGRKRIEERHEKRPGIRHETWLNPAGYTVPLPLGNANAIAEDGVTQYASQIRERKIALGFIPWHRCPVALVASQEIPSRSIKEESLLDANPCMGVKRGEPCEHALAEQAKRMGKHLARERERAEANKSAEQESRESLLESQKSSAEALRVLAERLGPVKSKEKSK